MTILVTGSSGFVAQSLIPRLEKLGFDVIGLDWKNGEHTKVIHDITKPLEIDDDIDTVIHLAARLEHERCSKEEFFKTNVDGTEQVLNLANSKNAYFIYVSTTAVYGSPECPITENTPIDPNGAYALTKWNGEKICKKYENNGLEVTIIRSGPILGQGRLGIYKTIFKNLQDNSFIPVLGNGDNKLSFVHVEDLVDFLIFLEKNKKLLHKKNIFHSYPHSWRSKKPLIFRNTTQWFISLEKENLREKAINALKDIDFFPKKGNANPEKLLPPPVHPTNISG